jgi:probable HAF family extracellular repeat protein
MKRHSLALLFLLVAAAQIHAEPTFTVTDLGTLGGNTTTATSVIGHGMNATGMIVGSSTTADNSEHAFLYVGDKMYDLNNLCDLGQSGFKVLTVARTISDSCVIIGDGISSNGDKHAFRLTPVAVAGGQWFYECCQWIWKQNGGGAWCWESGCGCYKWCGPPGKHPPCPPQPPPCWNWPLPCCPGCPPPVGPPPPPPPGGECWCCEDGVPVLSTTGNCGEDGPPQPVYSKKSGKRGKSGKRAADFRPCYPTREAALKDPRCQPVTPPPPPPPSPPGCWCCIDGKIVLTTVDVCAAYESQCYNTWQEASKDLRCQPYTPPAPPPPEPPPGCWCCINGQVVYTTPAICQVNEAQCYPTKEEALRHCRPPELCWCCINGQVVHTTKAACQYADAACYATKEEALKHCTPPTKNCWCCVTGAAGVTAVLTTEDVCKKRGQQCYATKEEALKHCGPTPTPSPEQPQCWCCINGQIVHTTIGDCQARGGQCYATEAIAKRSCKSPTTPTVTPTPPSTTPTATATPQIPRRRHSPTPSPSASASATSTPRRKHSRTQLSSANQEATATPRQKSKSKSPTPSPVPR